MKKPYFPFLAFLVLLLLTIPFSIDFTTSAAQGWHITIFPHYFIWGLIVVNVLLLAIIGYWLLLRRVDKINWTLFVIHFILTITSVIFIKFPLIFLDVQQINQQFIKAVSLRMKLIPVAWTLFIIGQVLFLVYFIRISNSKGVAA